MFKHFALAYGIYMTHCKMVWDILKPGDMSNNVTVHTSNQLSHVTYEYYLCMRHLYRRIWKLWHLLVHSNNKVITSSVSCESLFTFRKKKLFVPVSNF